MEMLVPGDFDHSSGDFLLALTEILNSIIFLFLLYKFNNSKSPLSHDFFLNSCLFNMMLLTCDLLYIVNIPNFTKWIHKFLYLIIIYLITSNYYLKSGFLVSYALLLFLQLSLHLESYL